MISLSSPSPEQRLAAGFDRFKREQWPTLQPRYQALARRGQRPSTLVIVGADARLDPERLFSAEPGELFVISNLGAIVPPYEPDGGLHGVSAAIEFGIRILKVRHVVVLGQSRCEAVRALMEGAGKGGQDFVEPWLSIAEPILWPIPRDVPDSGMRDHLERAMIRLSLENLGAYPWIRERLEARTLTISGFRFDLASGALESVNMAPAPSGRTRTEA